MSEEQTAVMDQTAATSAESWEGSPIAQIYHPDGKLREGAGDALKSLGYEDLTGFITRNNHSFFDTVTGGKEARTALSQRQEIAENSFVKPGEGATPEEYSEFATKLGALTKPEEYLEHLKPEDMPEGFTFDEGLAGFVSDWASKHPVNTPEAMKELAKGHVQFIQQMAEKSQQEEVERFNQLSQETAKTMTEKLGGPQAKAAFDNSLEEFVLSNTAKSLGFEFYKNEEGQIVTDNPLHAVMLNDVASLQLLRGVIENTKSATLPNGTAMPIDKAGLESRKRELLQNNSGYWRSNSEHEEYKAISERLRSMI